MVKLNKISISKFESYDNFEIIFQKKLNFIIGEHSVGKTRLYKLVRKLIKFHVINQREHTEGDIQLTLSLNHDEKKKLIDCLENEKQRYDIHREKHSIDSTDLMKKIISDVNVKFVIINNNNGYQARFETENEQFSFIVIENSTIGDMLEVDHIKLSDSNAKIEDCQKKDVKVMFHELRNILSNGIVIMLDEMYSDDKESQYLVENFELNIIKHVIENKSQFIENIKTIYHIVNDFDLIAHEDLNYDEFPDNVKKLLEKKTNECLENLDNYPRETSKNFSKIRQKITNQQIQFSYDDLLFFYHEVILTEKEIDQSKIIKDFLNFISNNYYIVYEDDKCKNQKLDTLSSSQRSIIRLASAPQSIKKCECVILGEPTDGMALNVAHLFRNFINNDQNKQFHIITHNYEMIMIDKLQDIKNKQHRKSVNYMYKLNDQNYQYYSCTKSLWFFENKLCDTQSLLDFLRGNSQNDILFVEGKSELFFFDALMKDGKFPKCSIICVSEQGKARFINSFTQLIKSFTLKTTDTNDIIRMKMACACDYDEYYNKMLNELDVSNVKLWLTGYGFNKIKPWIKGEDQAIDLEFMLGLKYSLDINQTQESLKYKEGAMGKKYFEKYHFIIDISSSLQYIEENINLIKKSANFEQIERIMNYLKKIPVTSVLSVEQLILETIVGDKQLITLIKYFDKNFKSSYLICEVEQSDKTQEITQIGSVSMTINYLSEIYTQILSFYGARINGFSAKLKKIIRF